MLIFVLSTLHLIHILVARSQEGVKKVTWPVKKISRNEIPGIVVRHIDRIHRKDRIGVMLFMVGERPGRYSFDIAKIILRREHS